MGGHQAPQQEHPEIGHLLYLCLTRGVHRQRLLLMVGLYTAGRTTAHLVDHATDVHPDHHLHQPLSGTLRHQETVQRQAGDADLALQFHRESGDACTERKLGDAEHLLGRKGV